MTWSYVGTSDGTFTTSPSTPTWPAGLVEGDIVVMIAMRKTTSETIGDIPTTSTTGWTVNIGYAGRLFYARYSSTLALPSIVFNAAVNCRWAMVAFRSTSPSLNGPVTFYTDNSAVSFTTTTPNTLLVMAGSQPGDQSVGWNADAGMSVVVNINGAYSGDASAFNLGIAWKSIASPSTSTGNRVYITANTMYSLLVGEQSNNQGFFFGSNF
jgi:hypothetical protein